MKKMKIKPKSPKGDYPKPKSFRLSDETVGKLNEICEITNKRPGELLTELIDAAHRGTVK